jgi:cytochrome P450
MPQGSESVSLDLQALSQDPYPIYARMREREPVAWIVPLRMWFVVRYADVVEILGNADDFTTVCESSTIFDTFGTHMLTSEGAEHERYRRSAQPAFGPLNLRTVLEAKILELTRSLIAGFVAGGDVELRAAFASRLPVQTVLALFGLPQTSESELRRWYESFGAALANFTWDPVVRAEAHANVGQLHEFLRRCMRNLERLEGGDGSLLHQMMFPPNGPRLSDEEIRRNATIIFFGGISSVEALILNAMWALGTNPTAFERVRHDFSLIPQAIEETMRWASPVQSATRHVTRDVDFRGMRFRAGDTVNCMLAAANRDPDVFVDPDVYDLDRPNTGKHVGFAVGPHSCLGFRLARIEARIALEQLLEACAGIQIDLIRSERPSGYEFRQPRRLWASWPN